MKHTTCEYNILPKHNLENFYVSEANEDAYNFIIKENKYNNYSILYGPSKSGKTHLGLIWKEINNDELDINIDYYSSLTEIVSFLGVVNLYEVNELHNYIISHLSNWWKKNHLIDNNIINLVTCNINSHNYSDLIDIKDKIENLSQFKSIKKMMISYNNNIEKIEFYGDYAVFAESLLLNNIEIKTNDDCSIRSIK